MAVKKLEFPRRAFTSRSGYWNDIWLDARGNVPIFRDGTTQFISNPNFQVQISKRLNASTDYRNYQADVIPHTLSGTTRFTQTDDGRDPTVCVSNARYTFATNTYLSDLVPVACKDQANSRFRERLATSSGRKNLLPVLGELGELRGTIGKTMSLGSDFLTIAKSLKRGNVRKAKSALSDAWLNFSFGVKPLISDVSEIASALEQRILSDGGNDRIIGSATMPIMFGRLNKGVSALYGGNVDEGIALSGECTVRYVGGYKIDWSNSNDYGYLAQFGLTASEIIPAAYELTAFSWLADYFSTLGDFVSDSFSATPSPIYLTESIRLSLSGPSWFSVGPPTSGLRITSRTSSCSPGYSDVWWYQRRSLATIPRRSLRLKSLDEISSNSLNRLANLAALLGK